jgi:ABC-2 type transport system ATP-binding protein
MTERMSRVKRREPAISASKIWKRYAGAPDGTGLTGFDLEVEAGSVCGLLGPNGAGKTTAIRVLSTLLRFDAGQASVAGFDVRRQAGQVRRSIGLVGQYAAVDEILTGRQNLVMFARLLHLSTDKAKKRANELLEWFGLIDAGSTPVHKYSGGMRRRLDLAASLLVAPAVLFVDEPTTGLDPQARREVWSAIRDLVDNGTTVLLTTQYLEEADQMADHISILRAGRVIADGTPAELKSTIGGDRIEVVLQDAGDLATTATTLAPLASAEIATDKAQGRLTMPVDKSTRTLIEVAVALSRSGIEPVDVTLRRPTLDEVFMQLTGTDMQVPR